MSVQRSVRLVIVSCLLLLPARAWAQAAGGTLEETQFSGGLSVGRTVTDACEVVAKVPEALFGFDPVTNLGPGTISTGTLNSWSPTQFCRVTLPWSAGTQGKFMIVYPLPWDLQASAIYQNIAGIPVTATNPAPNAQIRPSLGRDVGSCRGAATCNANVNIELVKPGTRYEDRLQQVDLRFSRRFQFGAVQSAWECRHREPVQHKYSPCDECRVRFPVAGSVRDDRRALVQVQRPTRFPGGC